MSQRKGRYQNRTEILQGTLDMLILQTLQWAPRHGYALSKAIRTNSGEILKVDTGSLYPALHRLERKGWIAAEWKASELGPRLREIGRASCRERVSMSGVGGGVKKAARV